MNCALPRTKSRSDSKGANQMCAVLVGIGIDKIEKSIIRQTLCDFKGFKRNNTSRKNKNALEANIGR